LARDLSHQVAKTLGQKRKGCCHCQPKWTHKFTEEGWEKNVWKDKMKQKGVLLGKLVCLKALIVHLYVMS
jgi:hypothetical protein